MISCRCGARLPVAVWHRTDFRCPECTRWIERCPGCLDWHPAMETTARFHCPYCGLDRDVITSLRTGELTLAAARQEHDLRRPGNPDAAVPDGQAINHDEETGEVTV